MSDEPQLLESRWSAHLALDVALMLENGGLTKDEILQRHSLSDDRLADMCKDVVFLRAVKNLREEVREKGLTFRMKARAQAEELLTTSWILIHSPDVSASVKADLIKSTVKWGGLEPKPDSSADLAGLTGGGVTININLDQAQLRGQTVDVTEDGRVLGHGGA